MSKRILVSSLVGVVVVGGVTAGGLAVASATATELTLENSSARYVAPTDAKAGSFTFTADVSDDSGVKSLKVLTWPKSSKLDPSEAEMRHVESATCKSTSDETSRCTYTVRVTKEEVAELGEGIWYVSALATAKDGDTKYVPRATTFEVTG